MDLDVVATENVLMEWIPLLAICSPDWTAPWLAVLTVRLLYRS
jgi:hypothetical protein